jgi:K+-sensing histidine kinase KdpD
MKNFIRRLVTIKDASLFIFDDAASSLKQLGEENQDLTAKVNTIYKEGILSWIFDSGKPTIIPEMNSFTASGPKLSFIFYPVVENGKKKGVLAILAPSDNAELNEMENQVIQVALGLCTTKIEKILLKEKLNNTYRDLQTYHAKLTNDYRLAAIGELTDGIVEDIKSPLQVIMSYADFMGSNESDRQHANIIKQQVKKINFLVNRLVKFSSINDEKINIVPCDINQILKEFYELVKSSLDSMNVECLLDFEENIPSILSNQNYIFQLMTNTLGIIKAFCTNGGGIIIQTRYINENILVKIINTASILLNNNKTLGLNLKIIDNIMIKHEGSFKLENPGSSGSVILLRFPLRRKIRI